MDFREIPRFLVIFAPGHHPDSDLPQTNKTNVVDPNSYGVRKTFECSSNPRAVALYTTLGRVFWRSRSDVTYGHSQLHARTGNFREAPKKKIEHVAVAETARF